MRSSSGEDVWFSLARGDLSLVSIIYIYIYIYIMKFNKIQFCSSIMNLFQVNKMTFFRWGKKKRYSYVFGYNLGRFTLLSVKRKFNFF